MKKGFTLAEVLITLAIIGIVATMTIPTLVEDYQKKAWETSAKVFNKKLTSALKVMNTQASLAGHRTTKSFVEELSNHFKITKTCISDNLQECFSSEVVWGDETIDMKKVKKAKHFGQKEWKTEIIGTQFANGTNALIAYNPDCKQDPYSNQISGSDCLAILYDTTGYKAPNTNGKDLHGNENIKKLGSKCHFENDDTCFGMPFQASVAHTWNACKEDFTSDDLEDRAYMQKYGLNLCYPGEDYYAYAVEQCGGISKMPQRIDVAAIASYIYKIPNFTGTAKANLSMIEDPTTLGFPNSAFYVWSNEEVSSKNDVPYTLYFGSDVIAWGYRQAISSGCSRHRKDCWAVCLVEE